MPKRVMMDNVITDEEEVEVEEKDDRKNNSKEKILRSKKAHPDCPAANRPSSSSPDSNPGKNNSGCGGGVVADAVVEQTVIETVIDIAITDAIIDSAVDNAATSTSDSDSDSDDSLSVLPPVRPAVVDNNEQEEKNVLADYDFSADREFWNGHRMTTISLDSTQGSETLLREEAIDNNHDTTTITKLGCVQCCCIIPALIYFLSLD